MGGKGAGHPGYNQHSDELLYKEINTCANTLQQHLYMDIGHYCPCLFPFSFLCPYDFTVLSIIHVCDVFT